MVYDDNWQKRVKIHADGTGGYAALVVKQMLFTRGG